MNKNIQFQPFEYRAALRQQSNEACHKHYQSKGMSASQITKEKFRIGDVIFWTALCTGQGGFAIIEGFDDKYVYVHDFGEGRTLRWYDNIRLVTPKQIDEWNENLHHIGYHYDANKKKLINIR